MRVDEKLARELDWKRVITRHRKVRVVPIGLTEAEMRALYAGICGVVMGVCRGREATAFVSCDEAHNILKQSNFPTPCERLITGGRKHGVECLHVSQRPQLLHTTVISQADKRVYFGISDDNDLRKIDQQSSFPVGHLKELKTRACIVENKNTGEWVEIDTDGIRRLRPHFSGDDGILDRHLPV